MSNPGEISRIKLLLAICGMVAAVAATTQTRAAVIGADVSNIAAINYTFNGTPKGFATPPAIFTVEALRTQSSISFFRYAPNAPDAVSVQLNGTDFSTGLDAGGNPIFQAMGAPVMSNGAVLDFSNPVGLIETENYFSGELIIVQIIDSGYNGDPNLVETIFASLQTQSGDAVTIRSYENAPDSGEFYGFILSTNAASPSDDPMLTISAGGQVTASYQDAVDLTDISNDVAAVDPAGRIFDSQTGALIDGAQISIVDANTGQPAVVYGIDGTSIYPSTISSGGTVTDASGLVYDLEPGEFLFPLMFPGDYRIVVDSPGDYSAPSRLTAVEAAILPNAPFIILGASYLQAFTLDGTGDVEFDIPLDPVSDFIVTKTASAEKAAIGDFLRYEISVENAGNDAASFLLHDFMPRGFRYQSGSARRDGAAMIDPIVSANGEMLAFTGGSLSSGQSTTISYVTEIAAGAILGEAVNQALVVSTSGARISNIAEAVVYLSDDFLRDHLSIVGRVAVNACDPDEAWPRRINKSEGVEGVRIYMETGASVATDEDGLFHFEDIDARNHVVQLDTASLPEGYEPVQCEENTRFAGSAISQFVDAQGGSLWRANFYLSKKAEDPTSPESIEKPTSPVEAFNDATEYKKFDKSWLNTQTPETKWVYPAPGQTPSVRAVHIGIKHGARNRVELMLNGVRTPPANYAGSDVDLSQRTAITRWRGVDLVEGENHFIAIIKNAENTEVERIERTITYVTEALRATYLPERSHLFADGINSPVIALRFTDSAGRPVRAGQSVPTTIDAPYRAKDLQRLEDTLPLTSPLAAKSTATVGPDGIALIELEPTMHVGNARIVVEYNDRRTEEFFVFVRPALRDWIVVGLVEGSVAGQKTQMNNGNEAFERLREGRVAVFAKGTVKGDWLVTAAVDTSKRRGAEDNELFDAVDPDARFSVYGDRSKNEFEAQSRFPVYLKAAKGAFQAMIGDYDTRMNQSKLGKYVRRLSGLQTTYEGEQFQFSAFAADTNQRFVRNEIAADGTSGPFRLDTVPMVRNSETISIESRDRFRADQVNGTTPLIRYLDYDIDFETGELLLRLPVAAANDNQSLNVIVVEYETSGPVERNLVTGGRGALRSKDGRAELGLTVIHEQGGPNPGDGRSDLGAVDLRVDISETMRAKFEYGISRRNGALADEDGDAMIAEIEKTGKNVTARAYFENADTDFGLNQRSSAAAGIRRYGAELSILVDEFSDERTGNRGVRFFDAKAYREENRTTGAGRTVAEVSLRQEADRQSASVGLRQVFETTAQDVRRKSMLLTMQMRQNFEKLGLTIRALRDQPLAGQNGSTIFPKRTAVGFDQKLFEHVTLSADHEIRGGDENSSSSTIVGLKAEPWTAAVISASLDKITQDSGERLGATFGVDQQVQIDDHWSASFGVSRREELISEGVVSRVDDIVPDSPVSPLEDTENYTSLFAGLGYRDDISQGSSRFEMRKSTLGNRYTGVLSAAREVTEALSFAGVTRIQVNDNNSDADQRDIDGRFGVAWRPRDNDSLIIFNRFDISHNKIVGEQNSWKAVNNLALNVTPMERWRLSINHGFKYAELEADNADYGGVTQLLGGETRFDVTEGFDIGFRGSVLHSHNARTTEYSYGPSLGVSPADNVWLTFGWNFSGFSDADFSAAEYAQRGPFIALRIKFDQNTARGLLDQISPIDQGVCGQPCDGTQN